jgi:long-chain acyl-CoA synthetase
MGRLIVENLAELYLRAAERFGDRPAFATKDATGRFVPLSYEELTETGLALATALIDRGLAAREHVGLLSDNRLEWILCDAGILLAGAADVPRGTDITEAEILYILDHADVRVVFVEHAAMLAKFEAVRGRLPRVETVILMDPKAEAPPGVEKLADWIAHGRALRAAGDRRAEERVAGVRPDDLFTIIYTSGTTGTPKGVQLTHANMASQIRNLPFDLRPGDRTLSILPIWHSYERVFEMIALSMGACCHYTSIRHIAEDLKTVKPTMMASAPRLWENLYQKMMDRIEKAPPAKRRLFAAARTATCHVKRAERFFRGQELDTTGRGLAENARRGASHLARWLVWFLPHQILDRLVLAKLREAVGCGHFRGTISGGGALQPHVDEFFNFIGIPVLEGYGLTETSPVLAVRTWDNLVIGTVGAFYPQTAIRIVDLATGEILYPDRSRSDLGRGRRGEIHASGPQVMRGYYKDPDTTARVLRDGWLNTGDIGMVTFNDCLKILGRSKDTIVLLNGENVEPTPIENRLVHSPLIDHCMVVGQDQKALGALILPALDGFRAAGLTAANVTELAADPRARALMEAEIRRIICGENGFKSFERIVDFRFLTRPFEVGRELTATFKLKRHVLTEEAADLIAEMYPRIER